MVLVKLAAGPDGRVRCAACGMQVQATLPPGTPWNHDCKRGKGTNKYGAQKTNGYDSKREARYADELGKRRDAPNGDVSYWLEQVLVNLSIGRYRIDFLVFMRDGSHRYIEVKGVEQRDWKLRMKALANEHPRIFERLDVVK